RGPSPDHARADRARTPRDDARRGGALGDHERPGDGHGHAQGYRRPRRQSSARAPGRNRDRQRGRAPRPAPVVRRQPYARRARCRPSRGWGPAGRGALPDYGGRSVNVRLSAPIGILDEHPEWSARLSAELEHRRLPFEKIDHSNHGFDPRDRVPRYSVIVNRTSPSSHRRGHGGVLFYAEALLAHYEALGVPIINPVRAYRFEKSKALQLGLFERLGVRYPRAVVVNHREQVLKALDRIAFPLVVKPNVGGSGAGIVRFDSADGLRAGIDTLDFGPDGTALVQEYIEPAEGAIVRVEVLDGRALYAIRIVREASRDFNLCPADICQVAPAPTTELGACAVETKP